MVALDNSPASETYLRLQARKSFALGLYVTDHHGRPLDLAGTSIRMVVRKTNFSASVEDDSANLIVNSEAELVAAGAGFARFHLQAADLDQKPGEYEYSVTLLDNGYSSVLLKGILDLVQNTEYNSTEAVYAENQVDSALQILLKGQHVVKVRTGPTLAPGTTSFTDSDKAKLDGIAANAQVNVLPDWNAPEFSPAQILNKPEHRLLPSGGGLGSVLIKRSANDYDGVWAIPNYTGDTVDWFFPGYGVFPGPDLFPGGGSNNANGTLDATGVPGGYAPIADGLDSWDWGPATGVQSINGQTGVVELNADEIIAGVVQLFMTAAERAKLAGLSNNYADLAGKPTLGSAAAQNVADFLPSTGISGDKIVSGEVSKDRVPKLSAHRGFSWGTASPSGGADGDMYFQPEA